MSCSSACSPRPLPPLELDAVGVGKLALLLVADAGLTMPSLTCAAICGTVAAVGGAGKESCAAEAPAYCWARWVAAAEEEEPAAPVVEAVAHHHHPDRVPQDSLDAVGIVYISNILAHQAADAAQSSGSLAQVAIDPEYLERLGVTEQFSGWQEMAKASAGVLHVES